MFIFRLIKTYIVLLLLFVASTSYSQQNFDKILADSAMTLVKDQVEYDPTYYSISYPNGDVPKGKGVCTDVVIRAYRKLGIDLQKEVHEDMLAHFSLYPNNWGLHSTDKNIDHRRVPNLMKYFERHGTSKPISENPEDYSPGDIVCWNLGGGITHIGLVVHSKSSSDPKRHQIVHNIGSGQIIEDVLFNYAIIGHYSFAP